MALKENILLVKRKNREERKINYGKKKKVAAKPPLVFSTPEDGAK